MRGILRTLALALILAGAATLSAATITVLDAVTTTGASAAVDTARSAGTFVHVYSASTSSATVLIQQSLDGTRWKTIVTITNPTSEGEIWSVEPTPYTRVNVTVRASGTLSALVTVSK